MAALLCACEQRGSTGTERVSTTFDRTGGAPSSLGTARVAGHARLIARRAARRRVLVLTSQSLYRVAFLAQNGSVNHYSRTSLLAIKRIERGRQAFRLCVSEPDGR